MKTIPFFQVTISQPDSSQFRLRYKRAIIPVLLIALLMATPTRDLVVNTLADAFWAVTSYVAFTLAIYHYLTLYMNKQSRIILLYNRSRNYQVFFAALLGVLPGCGGAIIVTSQFVSGRVGFGSMVAVLTATMGDAAFLLLASKPIAGLGIVATGFVIGCLSGWAINTVHSDDFLRPDSDCEDRSPPQVHKHNRLEQGAINLQGMFWKVMIVPATLVAFLGSFQVDVNRLLHLPEHTMAWVGAGLIIVCMSLWSLTKEIKSYESSVSEDKKSMIAHPLQKAAQDTNFVTAWVIVAFLLFEMTIEFTGVDLGQLFSGWGVWMPLLGLAVGLLPGCGPQILITGLYISGAVPTSTQLSNSISNDGDALFPAIALAPRAALAATLYSSIPALLVGYGYFLLFEM